MQLATPQFIVTLLAYAVVGGIVALAVQFYSNTKTFPKSYDGIWMYGRDWQMLVFIMALFVVGGLGHGLITSLEVDNTPAPTRIPSALTVKTADGEDIEINFYWDVLGQDPVISLDYGEIEQMGSSSLETWVRNEALIDVWLTLGWEDLIPVDADQYIRLSWDWVKLIDTWKAYPEEFSIFDAMLRCGSNPVDPIILARVDPGFNYEIDTRTIVTVSTRPESQIVFRYVDAQNYYFAGLGAWGYKAAIGRVVDGVATRLAEGGNPNYVDINLNQWYNVTVRVSGSTFTCYIDGEEMCTIEDSSIGYGDIGLRTLFSETYWDSYVVVDAFDPDVIIFQDYFVGSSLEVSTSRKVAFTITSIAATPVSDPPTATWDFTFDSVVISYDNPVEIKYPPPEP